MTIDYIANVVYINSVITNDGDKEIIMSKAAAIIKSARLANKLTQEELAAKVGVHVASVRNWEKGSVPQSAVAQRLAGVLGVETVTADDTDADPMMEFEVSELTKALHRKVAILHNVETDKVEISIRILA